MNFKKLKIINTLVSNFFITFSVLSACTSENNEKGSKNNEVEVNSVNNVKINTGLPYRFEKTDRIVAIGDLHGDLFATKQALKKANVIDNSDHWIGGKTTLVQTGDQLDRGDDEKEIIDLLDNLAIEAKKVGGSVHVLNGNHEIMNVAEDFRYVTKDGFEDFQKIKNLDLTSSKVLKHPEHERARTAALIPGSMYAKIFAKRNTIVVIGDILFLHGGLEPKYADYGIEKINEEVREWLLGETSQIPNFLVTPDGPIWSRTYSSGPEHPNENECKMLDEVLKKTNTKYMVVGHTVQTQGINSACNGKVWRIDIGLSKAYNSAKPQVLEIKNNTFNILK